MGVEFFKVMNYWDAAELLGEDVVSCIGPDYASFIIDFRDPKPCILARDYGEPEDNSFHRDYNWIVPLLNELAGHR